MSPYAPTLPLELPPAQPPVVRSPAPAHRSNGEPPDAGRPGSAPVRARTGGGRHHGRGRAPSVRSAGALLEQARQGVRQAAALTEPGPRYIAAHLAALRAAAAVLAATARPAAHPARPTSAWTLLPRVAPELAEWAAFFAAGSSVRAAAEAGITRLVTARSADDMVRQTGQFIALADRAVKGRPR
jgi:hypothetical protein